MTEALTRLEMIRNEAVKKPKNGDASESGRRRLLSHFFIKNLCMSYYISILLFPTVPTRYAREEAVRIIFRDRYYST